MDVWTSDECFERRVMTSLETSLDPRQSYPIQNVQDFRKALSAPNPLENLLGLDPSSAPFVVELLYTELQRPDLEDNYRRRCMKYLKAMGKRFHALPPSLFMKNITRDDHALTGGGFADIFKGKADDTNVCLKVLRVHMAETEAKRKRIIADFCQEALIWTQLRHPNILPLLGVNTELFPSCFCIVSPWMINGDLMSFLKANPSQDKLQLICEIIAGLEYLHSLSPPIVHGDIKGANILVDEDHHCRLADFGLATISAETTMVHTTTGIIKGSIRWMAPELYAFTGAVEKDEKEDKTPRDIYAFACTVLEILTGKPPFSNLIDAAVIYQVSVRQIRPERPSEGWCPDHIWNLVESCWDEDPPKRPRAKALHTYLQHLILSSNPVPGDPSFIGYFQPEGPGTPTSAELDYDTFESDDSSKSRTSPQSPGVLSPLPPELPQTFNSEGIAQVEDIPLPASSSVSQCATEFFRLNGRLLKEAVDNISSYGRNDRDIQDPDQTACEGLYNHSYVFVAVLEAIARLHPFIGVTVVAFKLSIVPLYNKRIRDKEVVNLMIRIQQTMALFLRLRNLSDPEDRGTDGQTIWDRLQELLVDLTEVIEEVGVRIEASIVNASMISQLVSLYSRKFDRFQEDLKRAFLHHTALSDSSFTPQVFATDIDRPQREEHWKMWMDNLVSQFKTLASVSLDNTNLPDQRRRRRRYSNSNAHEQRFYEETPRALPAPIPIPVSVLHLPHPVGNEAYNGTDHWHLVGKPRYPCTFAPSYGPPALSTPFVAPPPAYLVATPLVLNALLSVSATFTLLTCDFADEIINSNVQSFPPASSLSQATDPPVSVMRLVFDDDDFAAPPSTIGLSHVDIRAVASNHAIVRVTDVLEELHRALNRRISDVDWRRLDVMQEGQVSRAFHDRWRCSSRPQEVRDYGVKKVDYLVGRTRFRGLVEVEGRMFRVVLN